MKLKEVASRGFDILWSPETKNLRIVKVFPQKAESKKGFCQAEYSSATWISIQEIRTRTPFWDFVFKWEIRKIRISQNALLFLIPLPKNVSGKTRTRGAGAHTVRASFAFGVARTGCYVHQEVIKMINREFIHLFRERERSEQFLN